MQRPEPEKADQAPLKAEQAFLVELKAQGRKAQKHRDWERQVLFLKESDEDTRLDTLFEILLKRLDLPTAGMETEDFPEWEKEHREALSFLYQEPDLPEQCGPSGALTKHIRRLTSKMTCLPSVSRRYWRRFNDPFRLHVELKSTACATIKSKAPSRCLPPS
jgi:hypothetical protein